MLQNENQILKKNVLLIFYLHFEEILCSLNQKNGDWTEIKSRDGSEDFWKRYAE